MFQWLNKQGVASSEGFTVQSMHRHYYHYIEGDHVVRIMVERCRDHKTGQYYEEVAENSFSKWEPPFESEPLSRDRREQIKRRFFDALEFMEIEHRPPVSAETQANGRCYGSSSMNLSSSAAMTYATEAYGRLEALAENT